MQTLVLKNPMSVAVSVSIAGHLVLLFLALWLMGKGMNPAPSSWVLDLSLEANVSDEQAVTADHEAQTLNAPRADQAMAPLGDATAAAAVAVPGTRKPPQPVAGRSVADLQHVVPESASPPAETINQQVLAPESSPSPEVYASESSSIVVASSVPGRLKVRPPIETNPVSVAQVLMSPDQHKMLDKKFRQWTRDFHKFNPQDPEVTWKHRGQEYRASFEYLPAGEQTEMDQVLVRIETKRDGVRLTTDMHMKRLAFSNFAQFVNRWDPQVLVHDDVLSGRFHSNTKINLASDREARPVFRGKVTTSSRAIGFPEARGPVRRKEIFLGGLETGVRQILLPRRFSPFRDDGAAAGNRTHRFEGDTEIVFYGDGSFGHRPIGSDSSLQRRTMRADAAYLVGAPRKTLELRGVVRGKVLVYSPERITITGDLTYARHPREAERTGDYLGLVSDKYIDIAPPEVTGPGDLEIHASIYARRRFSVRNYRRRQAATFYLFGSLTAGTMSATEPRFATRIEYDERLEDLRAPGFPVTDRYEVVSFNETWRIEAL